MLEGRLHEEECDFMGSTRANKGLYNLFPATTFHASWSIIQRLSIPFLPHNLDLILTPKAKSSFKFNMVKISPILIVVACTAVVGQVYAAHSAWCTHASNGSGSSWYEVTKDCCAATREHSTTGFDELSHRCEDAGGLGNGLNLGRFVSCCGSRGAGSHSPN